ncbi:MAG: histidine phosphatase family protein [Deltaproteobacteria bacterium HGW-Deltaproteobacteria-19]|jgi:broad specificity phosphatase PhoE|nr:MAG: histidine phosphatase family protein [Deltaproteobacteria bacterium HGW-Deltaproteobacteria-19]
MSRIVLIRHGQASFGKDRYDRLSRMGWRQARILASHLFRAGCTFDSVCAGDLERQQDTAQAVLAHYDGRERPLPPLETIPEFNEYPSRSIFLHYFPLVVSDDPSLESNLERLYKDRKAFQRVFEAVIRRWTEDPSPPEDIVGWDDFRATVASGLQKLLERNGRGSRIAVFTSGGPISAAVQTVLGLSTEETFRLAWIIRNASVTEFLHDGERLSLLSFNGTAHLELEGDPSVITYR